MTDRLLTLQDRLAACQQPLDEALKQNPASSSNLRGLIERFQRYGAGGL